MTLDAALGNARCLGRAHWIELDPVPVLGFLAEALGAVHDRNALQRLLAVIIFGDND